MPRNSKSLFFSVLSLLYKFIILWLRCNISPVLTTPLSHSSLRFLSSDVLINCSFPLVNLSFVSLIYKATANEPTTMGRGRGEYFLPDITDFLWDQGNSLNLPGPSLPHFLNDTAWVRSTQKSIPALSAWGCRKIKGLLLYCYCYLVTL